jgi:nicotinamidase-related amidase
MADSSFKPALIVVDMQEDFCPPVSIYSLDRMQASQYLMLVQNGSLAVTEGRDIIPAINDLLGRPGLVFKIATQDWHPADHISFAANHGKQPFTDFCTVTNPSNPAESYETRLWPVHCVQDTPGAELLPELETGGLDEVLKKGVDSRVEMYSAFYPPLSSPRVSDSGLASRLKAHGITHVYVVGLAADYCVKSTALDAMREGFTTVIIEEATRPVDAAGWPACKHEIEGLGVKVVSIDGVEVKKLDG